MPIKPAKISGVLNNCAFNCALPTILENIGMFADAEKNQTSFPEGEIFETYKQIKNTFADFYRVNKAQFTWQQFRTLLANHSFPANELIFAPVFRAYMASKPKPPLIVDGEVFIDEEHDLTNDFGFNVAGKYPMLAINEMHSAFYAPLGINVQLFNYNNGHYTDITNAAIANHTELGSSPTQLYRKEDHYNLHEDHSVPQSWHDEIDRLPAQLKFLHDKASAESEPEHTLEGITTCQEYVHYQLTRPYFQFDWMITLKVVVPATLCLVMLVPVFNSLIVNVQLNSIGRVCVIAAAILCLRGIVNKHMYITPDLERVEVPQPTGLFDDSSDGIAFLQLPLDGRDAPLPIDNPTNNIEVANDSSAAHAHAGLNDTATFTPVVLPNTQQNSVSANFQFNCMIGLAVAGAAILCVAICAFPPVSIPTLVVGAALLLTSAGMFASQKATDVNSESRREVMSHD